MYLNIWTMPWDKLLDKMKYLNLVGWVPALLKQTKVRNFSQNLKLSRAVNIVCRHQIRRFQFNNNTHLKVPWKLRVLGWNGEILSNPQLQHNPNAMQYVVCSELCSEMWNAVQFAFNIINIANTIMQKTSIEEDTELLERSSIWKKAASMNITA